MEENFYTEFLETFLQYVQKCWCSIFIILTRSTETDVWLSLMGISLAQRNRYVKREARKVPQKLYSNCRMKLNTSDQSFELTAITKSDLFSVWNLWSKNMAIRWQFVLEMRTNSCWNCSENVKITNDGSHAMLLLMTQASWSSCSVSEYMTWKSYQFG